MGKYGDTAVRATELLRKATLTPEHAWNSAAREIFPNSLSSQAKGCPRGAFLGLYYSGHLRGISPATQNSALLGANARYAVEAVSLLAKNPELAIGRKAALWSRVMLVTGNDIAKKHNAQMDVVVSLWQSKLVF